MIDDLQSPHRRLAFEGIDPGRHGGVARIVGRLPDEGEFLVDDVFLAPLPMRERDDGGHELDAPRLAEILRFGGPLLRIVVEVPSFGGTGGNAGNTGRGSARRRPKDVLRQGATWGGARAVAELVRAWESDPVFGPTVVDDASAGTNWRKELDLPAVKSLDERKAANIAEAERLLALWLGGGAKLEIVGAPARGYEGRLPGQKDARSGVADGLLLAWLGVRRWLGGGKRRRKR